MKILNISVSNFGSYSSFDFNFENGLSLVYGATGAGKSTIQDAVCWTLFGVTAKNGPVDEVRSWTASDSTTAKITVEVGNALVYIYRGRGKPYQNDLYYMLGEDPTQKRGKDILDTQQLINKVLGFDKDLYMSASYFNEFSPVNRFFLSRPTEKRYMLEDIADTGFAIECANLFKEKERETKQLITLTKNELSKAEVALIVAHKSLEDKKEYNKSFELTKEDRVKRLQLEESKFETIRQQKIESYKIQIDAKNISRLKAMDKLTQKISKLDKKLEGVEAQCPTCGTTTRSQDRVDLDNALVQLDVISNEPEPLEHAIEAQVQLMNTYPEQIQRALAEVNPYQVKIKEALRTYKLKLKEHNEVKEKEKILKTTLDEYTLLHKLSFDLRGEMLKRAIDQIKEGTNSYLEKYFESEIKLDLQIENSDEILVSLVKNGNECSYSQLSKGQRGLLKLCFSVAYMKSASNNKALHFDTLFFDEALDGLDIELKLKAFSLFQELNIDHKSIFLIDHCEEFKNLFDNKYHVTLKSDRSEIKE